MPDLLQTFPFLCDIIPLNSRTTLARVVEKSPHRRAQAKYNEDPGGEDEQVSALFRHELISSVVKRES